ncbi:MAG: hypothetical protein AB8B72_10020 [Crocinitomicaceae bacterium]
MNDTEVIISLLDNSERLAFLAYLKKRNKRNDTKNIQLFNALINGSSEKIKSEITKNAYNVLKKRLTDRLIDFTAGSIIESEQSDQVAILKRLFLSQRLFKHKHYKTAFRQLLKAESKAIIISDYHLLNEIYRTFIQYSFHPLSPPQSDLFKAYKKNKVSFENDASLNIAYAILRKAFLSQSIDQKQLELNEVIATTFEQVGINNNVGYTFQTLNQIAEIADITGTHQRNYADTDLFFEKHLKDLKKGATDTEKQLTYHIKLIYLLAHIYFRKKKFKKSLQYLKDMYFQMNRYNSKYYELYKVKHTTLTALNFNYSGNNIQAAFLLDELKITTSQINSAEVGILNVILVRTVIHFQQEEFEEAKYKIAQLWQQDSWFINNMGLEWLLNKKFIEILLEIELGNTNLVDSLISALTRKKATYFKGATALALPFLKLVEAYHKHPNEVTSDKFQTLVESSFNWKPTEKEDLFFMSYYAWLKSKMTGKSVYEITLGFLDV